LTCIIADKVSGIMVADDLLSCGNGFMAPIKAKKIERSPHALWGLSGAPGAIIHHYPRTWGRWVRHELAELFSRHCTDPENGADALVLDSTGLYLVEPSGVIYEASGDLMAIGSGAEAALAYASGYLDAVGARPHTREYVLVQAVWCAARMNATVSDNVQVEMFRG
jgi:hypothetical protein